MCENWFTSRKTPKAEQGACKEANQIEGVADIVRHIQNCADKEDQG